MKYLNIACGLLMILFAGVQFNDPDGLLWAAIYLVPSWRFARISFKTPFRLACLVYRPPLN